MKNESINVVALVRVSTEGQNTDRQESELSAEAKSRQWNIIETVRMKISGRSVREKREDLDRVLELVNAGKVKKVMIHEVSRLARKNSVLHQFVETLSEKGVSLYWHAQRIETLLPTGKVNPAASLMLALLGEMARAEAELTGERIRSGIANRKAKGLSCGRPAGWRMEPEKLLSRHKDITRLLRTHHSIRNTAALTKKSTATVQAIKRILDAA